MAKDEGKLAPSIFVTTTDLVRVVENLFHKLRLGPAPVRATYNLWRKKHNGFPKPPVPKGKKEAYWAYTPSDAVQAVRWILNNVGATSIGVTNEEITELLSHYIRLRRPARQMLLFETEVEINEFCANPNHYIHQVVSRKQPITIVKRGSFQVVLTPG